LSWWLAFGAGLLSFFSPCCLPLYPSFLSYITGVSVAQLKDPTHKNVRGPVLLHTLFFIIGFSIVFFALGFTVSFIGEFFIQFRDLLRMITGVFLVAMGLFLLGIFQPRFLMTEKRLFPHKRRWGFLGSFFIGIGFAAGWTPCNGPILASVLSLTLQQPEKGFFYITSYTLGFAVPFFIMAFFIGKVSWFYKYADRVMKIGGILMILLGILLYFNQMSAIIQWFNQLMGLTS
jgi:cytochrome c-type biogenesis protein